MSTEKITYLRRVHWQYIPAYETLGWMVSDSAPNYWGVFMVWLCSCEPIEPGLERLNASVTKQQMGLWTKTDPRDWK